MSLLKQFSKEYSLFVAIIAYFVISYFEHTLAQTTVGNLIGFTVLFGVIIYSSLSVAHHAEKFGEPYGTLILTLSAVIVEIVIIVIMMLHSHNPLLARDTIYSAIMLDINALLGLAAIIGGLKYGEQPYNIDSSNSYLSMLLVAIGVAMVIPHFIDAPHQELYSLFIVVIFVLLYITFTRIQVSSHKYFFEYNPNKEEREKESHSEEINAGYHAFNLILTIPAVIVVSRVMGMEIDLAITPLQGIMLSLTLLVSIVNFNDGETNMLEGFLHVILFIVFAFLLFM